MSHHLVSTQKYDNFQIIMQTFFKQHIMIMGITQHFYNFYAKRIDKLLTMLIISNCQSNPAQRTNQLLKK